MFTTGSQACTGSDAPDISELQELSTYYYCLYKEEAYGNLSIGMIYGAYIVVYITSVYVLLSKPGFTSSPPRLFMFGITTFQFALGIVALVLVTNLDFQSMRTFLSLNSGLPHSYEISSYAWAGITCLMYILCDIVCAWRTVVIWKRDKHIIAILALFILGTIASAGYAIATGLVSNLSPDNTSLTSAKHDLILIGPIVATNLLSTGLTFWRAWQRRITVGNHLREGGRYPKVERVFALLIETGLIYCCCWIYYWITRMGLFSSSGPTVIVFVSGIYPTLIIILVSKQMSPVEHYSIHSRETQFARVPALGSPRDGGEPGHMLTIRRDYTSDSEAQIPSTVLMKPSDEEMDLLP